MGQQRADGQVHQGLHRRGTVAADAAGTRAGNGALGVIVAAVFLRIGKVIQDQFVNLPERLARAVGLLNGSGHLRVNGGIRPTADDVEINHRAEEMSFGRNLILIGLCDRTSGKFSRIWSV